MRELTEAQRVERSLQTTFRKRIWQPFTAALNRYELIRAGDSVCCCISGGKDSMLLAKLLQELQRHSDVPFTLSFLVMDPGYRPEVRRQIEENLQQLEIPAKVIETDIFEAAETDDRHPCFLCAKMRRGNLYAFAKEMGCNKIALGHHFNDVIETTLLSLLYGGQLQTMPPKLHSDNFAGMELIRPLYMVHEEDIIAWAEENGLRFIRCACSVTARENGGKRQEVKQLIAKLKETNPNVERNIFGSIHAVSLNTMIEWKDRHGRHSFLEEYDEP